MTQQDQWKVISGRIHGLMQAAQLHARFLAIIRSDPHGRANYLRDQVEEILSSLVTFRESFEGTLPSGASASIDRSVEKISGLVRDTSGSGEARQQRVWAALVLLGAFETEMSFVLSDMQQTIRAHSERAFSHLQRLIAVDEDLRAKWKASFESGEVACEKLGAVHLLQHGIWAFKVDAAGARTDLVFEEPIRDQSSEQRYADGLVLTE